MRTLVDMPNWTEKKPLDLNSTQGFTDNQGKLKLGKMVHYREDEISRLSSAKTHIV